MARTVAAFVLILAVGAAAADGACRTDRLGQVLCGPIERPVPRPFDRELEFGPGEEAAFDFVPSSRENAFGVARPPPYGADRGRGFGEPLRIGRDREVCTRNALGHIRCH